MKPRWARQSGRSSVVAEPAAAQIGVDWVKVLALLVSLGSLIVATVAVAQGQLRAEPRVSVTGASWVAYHWRTLDGELGESNGPSNGYYFTAIAIVSNPGLTNITVTGLGTIVDGEVISRQSEMTVENCLGVGPRVLEPGASMAVLMFLPEKRLPNEYFLRDALGNSYIVDAPLESSAQYNTYAFRDDSAEILDECFPGLFVPRDATDLRVSFTD